MAFDLQAGFGAGAGADMLQQILRQKAQEAFQNQSLALAQQRQQQEAELQKAQLASIQADRQAKEQQMADVRSVQAAGMLEPGMDTLQSSDPITKIIQGGIAGATLHPDQRLGSTNLSGAVGGPINATANPGQATGALRFGGLPGQLQEQKANAALEQLAQDHPEYAPALRVIGTLPDPKERAAATAAMVKEISTPTKPVAPTRLMNVAPGGTIFDPDTQQPVYKAPDRPDKPQIVPVMTVDAQGNPITQFVTKQEGQTYARPVSGVVENRIKGAQTVTEMGNDIIKQVTDPKVAATLGPVMGRYSSIQDFIGNPPPEYSELAGEIESYALANMGVHGMRSAQGAQMIQKLLSGKHTPESLAATVRGLNKFSTAFVQNATPGGSTATPSLSAPATATPAPNIIRYDMNGNVIKQD